MTQFALYEMPKKECRRVAISVPIPKWLPPSLALWLRQRMAERPEGKLTVATRFSNGERAAMKRRRPVPISAWAEKHRVLEMSAIRGRWRNVFTPYLTGIMDVSGLPGIETVIICKSPQTGGSECGHNIVGYCIDRLPGPVMYVFPDELTARENAKDRIIPMIEASPRLRQYMTGYGDDASSLRINLLHMPIYLGWSGSVSRLGNKPIRILILDELDKYKNPKNEASSESLAEKRTTTWRTRRKVVKISTPTTEDGPIWKALTEEAGARFNFGCAARTAAFSSTWISSASRGPERTRRSPRTPKPCWRSGWPTTPVSTAARCGMTATATGRSGEGSGATACPALS